MVSSDHPFIREALSRGRDPNFFGLVDPRSPAWLASPEGREAVLDVFIETMSDELQADDSIGEHHLEPAYRALLQGMLRQYGTIHWAVADGVGCNTKIDYLNSLTDRDLTTCRRCLRVMRQTMIRNVQFWERNLGREEYIAWRKEKWESRGRTYPYDTSAEALEDYRKQKRALDLRLGL